MGWDEAARLKILYTDDRSWGHLPEFWADAGSLIGDLETCYAHLARFARYARYSRGALLVKRAIFQGRRMSRSASPPLLQQLAPLAKAAPLDSQQNTLLN